MEKMTERRTATTTPLLTVWDANTRDEYDAGRVNVLCFGGPLNAKVLPIDRRRDHLHGPVPVRERAHPLIDPPVEHDHFRTVRYDIKPIGARIDGEAYIWRVAIAHGYPEDRITGAMNVVLVMCRLPLLAWMS